MRLRHITATHNDRIIDVEVEAESAEALLHATEEQSLCLVPAGTPAGEITAILSRVMATLARDGCHKIEAGISDIAMDHFVLIERISAKVEELNRINDSGLVDAVAGLRRLCNEEISRASMAAYRPRPCADIINPDVPFRRVNALLRACDQVFAEMPR